MACVGSCEFGCIPNPTKFSAPAGFSLVYKAVLRKEKADWRVVSIREFCDLQMPLLMFDKDGNFCVLRLEEVSLPGPR